MPDAARLAIAGVGNNISALLQGIAFYGSLQPHEAQVGVLNEVIEGLRVTDIEAVAAFDVDPQKVGIPLPEAIMLGTNNFPHIATWSSSRRVLVEPGLQPTDLEAAQVSTIAERLKKTDAEVLLLSLPADMAPVARAYAEAALVAGVGVVNCSPDQVARDEHLMSRFTNAGLPLLGDDLASQFGSSLIHRNLLDLLRGRGLRLDGTYQVNLGGNEDFRNLRTHGTAKLESKLNVLGPSVEDGASLTVIPSGGYIEHLQDRKVAHISIEGRGWAGAPFSLQLRLEVQDSSNAAGVIVDLVRVACMGVRNSRGGFILSASKLLKSPPRQ